MIALPNHRIIVLIRSGHLIDLGLKRNSVSLVKLETDSISSATAQSCAESDARSAIVLRGKF